MAKPSFLEWQLRNAAHWRHGNGHNCSEAEHNTCELDKQAPELINEKRFSMEKQ